MVFRIYFFLLLAFVGHSHHKEVKQLLTLATQPVYSRKTSCQKITSFNHRRIFHFSLSLYDAATWSQQSPLKWQRHFLTLWKFKGPGSYLVKHHAASKPWLTFEIKNQRDLEQHQTIFNFNFYQPMLKSLIKASSLATQRHPQKSQSSSMILINEYNKCIIKLIIWTTGWFWMLNSRDSVRLVLHKWIVYKKALRNVQKFIKTG